MGKTVIPASARRTAASGKLAAAARTPRQVRGQARVDGILDAAAEVIVKEGLAGVTMHDLARRTQTSIGSLYYFFPDRESVLGALYERHRAASREISRQLAETPGEVWQQLSTADAIERLVTPYVEYLRRHPDFLPLMHSRPSESDADFIRTVRQVLDARLPGVKPAERESYAVMLHAVGAGAIWMGVQADLPRIDTYLREIPRVLTAYLAAIEAAARR
ncbi:TetR family transcriptional regulator [Achromobacter pulmonis]|uniref:TetR family transcriptional regulator n=1 Tax=Achromobacter pulmonis TaxID=1389932 RepID=A0A2N8KJQ3_9BURK|nr:TetR family transcriptional regulator [Achromobacter pulmonis]